MNNRFILAKPNIIALIAGIFLFILLGETSARADEKIRENLLPKTATNTYNILLIGSFLFVIGSILLFFYNRKVRNNE